jgi:hypothetical protein
MLVQTSKSAPFNNKFLKYFFFKTSLDFVMAPIKKFFLFLTLLSFGGHYLHAQMVMSTSSYLKATAATDRTVFYNVADSGIHRNMLWGLDTSWLDANNIKRGLSFMGSKNIDIVRLCFQPSWPLVNEDLQQPQIDTLNLRLNMANLVGKNVKVRLFDDTQDGKRVNAWYAGNATRWAQLIEATTRRVQESGHPVVSVAPFNEPDYTYWNQGSITDFKNINAKLRTLSRFDTIRICGANTLDDGQALTMYNTLKTNLDEGNTHQLAGSFDNFVNFYQQVKTDGKYATGDELHNVVEPMVGLEYGMQEGIWWETAERTRSEFVKASKGARLAYAEHRNNWTAASVYRNPEGKLIAFGGTSERQAVSTSYRFASTSRDVYYDGYGPTREYVMAIPGGTGYQKGQTNAEGMVNISYGDDIQPIINGAYYLVNRNSHLVLRPQTNNSNGSDICQYAFSVNNLSQWNVVPVSTTIGGDFSYFTITNVNSGKSMDDTGWSLNDNSHICTYTLSSSKNQQWFLDYAGDGWFYIRNRYSGKYLQIAAGSTSSGAAIVQNVGSELPSQQWRLVPATAKVDFIVPKAPSSLVATSQSASVLLHWSPSISLDLKGYEILRAENLKGPYNTIARYVTTTDFIDHSATVGTSYYYTVRAEDLSLNRSLTSDTIVATVSDNKTLIAEYNFEDTTTDATMNKFDCALYGTPTYITGKVDQKALSFDGTTNFVQLPYTISNHASITLSTWVYWKGGNYRQRIFDFGNGDTQYFYLSPAYNYQQMRFAIKNGGDEQQLDAPVLTKNKWQLVTLTISDAKICLYVDGALVASTTNITLRPLDFMPAFNYLGRSQSSEALFNGSLDDFRIYNYELSADEIKALALTTTGISPSTENSANTLYDVYDLRGILVKKHVSRSDIHLQKGTYILKSTEKVQPRTQKVTFGK